MRTALIPLLAVTFLPACERGDTDEAVTRLSDIDKRMARMERKLDQIAAGRPAGAARGASGQGQGQRRGPDPAVVYSIPVDGSPVRGNPKAPVTIVEAFEFACPACEGTRPFVKEVVDKLGDRVRVVQKTFIVHPGKADIPAHAGCAANLQGKWEAMETLIWDEGFKARDLSRDNMVKLAGKAGLDRVRFEKDMDGTCVERIKKEHQTLMGIGTSGTPTFFVNGRVLQGRSLEVIEKMVAEEEKKAAERIAQGTRPEEYYDKFIVAAGKKTL